MGPLQRPSVSIFIRNQPRTFVLRISQRSECPKSDGPNAKDAPSPPAWGNPRAGATPGLALLGARRGPEVGLNISVGATV